ncbi:MULTISPECIES: GatB/YqeY domain-containing protein [Methylomonas]|uniref:GatB/YqeY domain-containing protein n=1 Tax=Methylomonas TaxID=416 RepID=UPI0012329515|nr:GatB/YqeY domain-containing protein [Methylomonas rhizoryzae]
MSELKERIKEDMKVSMKSGDKARLGVIRMILAAIKQVEVDERIELGDDRVVVVLDKMLKQRRESIKQYRDANRVDLAEVEEAEIAVIQDFLPKALTEAEIEQMIDKAIQESGASSIKDMGAVMAILKPQMQGRADMAAVSATIKAKFAG